MRPTVRLIRSDAKAVKTTKPYRLDIFILVIYQIDIVLIVTIFAAADIVI
jgi:hypothetical protein